MIAIHGNIPANNITLIDELKKFFEADTVILDWNGKDKADPGKTTLAITSKKPPYQTPCSIMTLEAAQRILVA